MPITIDKLQDGIKQVNQAYIEQPALDGNYPAMVVQYLISAFLIAQGGKADDFGLYRNADEVGYIGWISIADEVLFFAPTKAIVLKRYADESDSESGELSPYGEL